MQTGCSNLCHYECYDFVFVFPILTSTWITVFFTEIMTFILVVLQTVMHSTPATTPPPFSSTVDGSIHKALSFCIQLNGSQSCVYQANYFILQMLKATRTLSPCEHIQQLKELKKKALKAKKKKMSLAHRQAVARSSQFSPAASSFLLAWGLKMCTLQATSARGI